MIKLIENFYDANNNSAYVKLETDEGHFEGYAFLHPEDAEYASEFLGFEIAELKATKDYYAKKLNRLRIEIKTLEDLLKDYIHHARVDEADLLKKRLNQKIAQKAIYLEDYEGIKYELKVLSESHNEFIDKLRKKTQENK